MLKISYHCNLFLQIRKSFFQHTLPNQFVHGNICHSKWSFVCCTEWYICKIIPYLEHLMCPSPFYREWKFLYVIGRKHFTILQWYHLHLWMNLSPIKNICFVWKSLFYSSKFVKTEVFYRMFITLLNVLKNSITNVLLNH